MDSSTVVRSFFEAMQRRDWAGAASWLVPDVGVWWPTTDERFRGGDFLAMQEAYPEGWEITVEEIVASADRVAARVAVDQDGERFWCHGFYTVAGNRITDGVDLWATEGSETPPEWRRAFVS